MVASQAAPDSTPGSLGCTVDGEVREHIAVCITQLQLCSKTAVPGSCGAQVATTRARSLAYVLLNWGIIVAHFLASDYIYLQDFPHWQCYAILGALWLAIYKAFDNTRQVAPCSRLLQPGCAACCVSLGHRAIGCCARLPDCCTMAMGK